MARIRSIKPEFWTSEQVMDVSPNARLTFIGIWNFSDDAGIHPASPKRLKAELFPADDVSSEDVRRMVAELVEVGLIQEYEVDGEAYWAVTGWHHQKIDQPSYKYPNPDGTVPEGPAKRRQTAKSNRKKVESQKVFAERSPPEGKGEEGKGEEGKGRECEGNRSSGDLLTSPGIDEAPPSEIDIVVATYNRLLPDCQSVQVVNPKRQKRITAVCKLARRVCREQGWAYDPQGFWVSYWLECASDPWLSGRKPNPNNPAWKQSIDVLLDEDRFAKVMDQAISAMRREAA